MNIDEIERIERRADLFEVSHADGTQPDPLHCPGCAVRRLAAECRRSFGVESGFRVERVIRGLTAAMALQEGLEDLWDRNEQLSVLEDRFYDAVGGIRPTVVS